MNTSSPQNAYLYGDHPIFANAEVSWVAPEKGVRLRLAKWKKGTRGTVHIFNGRTEYIERYADLVADFQSRGFAVTVHDWRGQGLSTRNSVHPTRCHVMDFDEFQRDAAAIMKACEDMPSPRRLYCHSMGGAIGLRFLHSHPEFHSAVFSAPMWGIQIPAYLRPILKWFKNYIRTNGKEWSCCVGTKDETYELYTPFWRNVLTSDRQRYKNIRAILENFPKLGIGGPTYHWYFAAERELEALQQLAPPKVASLVFLGTKEKLVEPKNIHEYVAKAPDFRLITLRHGKHEPYIERPALREEMWSHIDSFWLTD